MIHFNLNGKDTVSAAQPNERLLDVLRGEFRLTGVKSGCREGECGACSVILDGLLANSCLVAMGSVEGSTVVTIEGYSQTTRYKALERAFADVNAVQCGFCTPGIVLAAECLLARKPHPTRDEIRDGLSGNLCRCTGYVSIVEAVENASKEGDGLW